MCIAFNWLSITSCNVMQCMLYHQQHGASPVSISISKCNRSYSISTTKLTERSPKSLGNAVLFQNEPRVTTFSMHCKQNIFSVKQSSDIDVELQEGTEDMEYLAKLQSWLEFHSCTVLQCTVLFCAAMHCTVLCCNALYCTVYCTVLYCTVLYCTGHCNALHCSYCIVVLNNFNLTLTFGNYHLFANS